MGSVVLLSQLFDAIAADLLASEDDNVVCVSAENAGGLILLEDYAVSVNEDLPAFSGGESEGSSGFNGEHKSAQFVDFSYDSK